MIDSVLDQAREALQGGDAQATTQASAALVLSLNTREAEGTGSLDAQQAVQMRENVLELVSSAAAAGAVTAAAVGQTASAVEAVVEVVDQVSEDAATKASSLVGSVVNSSLGISESINPDTSTTLVRTCSSLFSAIERQETGRAATTGAGGDASAAAAANGTSQALYGDLRDSLGGIGHLMVKESLVGESATKVLAGRVQIGVSLVASTALRSASFEAPRGNDSGSVAFPPDLGLGASAAVEVSFTSLQVNTHGQWHLGASDSPATEYLDISLSDHTSLAPLAVKDAPQPLVLLIPIDADVLANPEPAGPALRARTLSGCAACATRTTRGLAGITAAAMVRALPPSPTRALPLALPAPHLCPPNRDHNSKPDPNHDPYPNPKQVRACTGGAGATVAPPPTRAPRRCLSTAASVACVSSSAATGRRKSRRVWVTMYRSTFCIASRTAPSTAS